MKSPGMAKIWHDLAADNRSLLDGIRRGIARRSYSEDDMKMLEAEAAQYDQWASEYEMEPQASDRREADEA